MKQTNTPHLATHHLYNRIYTTIYTSLPSGIAHPDTFEHFVAIYTYLLFATRHLRQSYYIGILIPYQSWKLEMLVLHMGFCFDRFTLYTIILERNALAVLNIRYDIR